MSAEFLLDHSAWIRSDVDSLPDSRADEFAEDYETGRLAVCLPFMLEAGLSARTGRDHAELTEELLTLPFIPVNEEVERRALDAQAQLARAAHHRMPPVDVLIAAIADCSGLGVLHYDRDYDVVLEKTDLDFHSQWLMPPGSID
jgi:predicted nucleic acid-binding protein